MKIDLTKYAAMVANAAAQVKISSDIFKNFISNMKTVIDSNDDLRIAHEANTTTAHGVNTKVSKSGDTLTGNLNIEKNEPSTTYKDLNGTYYFRLFGDLDSLFLEQYQVSDNSFVSTRMRIVLNTGDMFLGDGTKLVWRDGNSGPFYKGSGSPEGIVTAPVGSIYQRTDGGASTTLYVKQSGAGNVGWSAK